MELFNSLKKDVNSLFNNIMNDLEKEFDEAVDMYDLDVARTVVQCASIVCKHFHKNTTHRMFTASIRKD